MTVQRFLTGITTSGEPHLGNYVGAIRPAIAASLAPNVESFYFLADYHALIKIDDPARIQRSTLEISQITGWTRAMVKMRAMRARVKLRQVARRVMKTEFTES